MKEYLDMWKNWRNFTGFTNRKGFWMAFLIYVIITGVLEAIISVIPKASFVLDVFALVSMVPGIALTIRRLRDAGKKWTNIFLAFIPLVGAVVLVVYLCGQSVNKPIED